MYFDPNNNVIRLCTRGIELEVSQNPNEAQQLFLQAWNEAANDFERFTAAHYVARHQTSVEEKLKWDETALALALKIDDVSVKASYPSLYLNIAKCYEDLNDLDKAKKHYESALFHINGLPDNGYGKMIKSRIETGLIRLENQR